MTTPTQDRDITATLSAPREEPTAEALEAAAARLLRGRKNGRHCYGPAGRWQVYQCNDDSWSAGALMPLPQGAPVEDSRSLWYHGRPTAQAAAVDLLRHHPELWPAEPDETAPDHWATIRAALAPGATDDARAAALVAVDALSTQEDR